ncbi:hypothetical protein KP509_24G030700 [Ceratopteris richardii]|uniref:C2H2-type domain-containing protein n=1 Tax=Ceratopteris richardii TaxID=49495 RepID=A0A8T2RW18_CERRI|nr:hypothetical protein KP509_24G030700 [Ceratopteris richardii]
MEAQHESSAASMPNINDDEDQPSMDLSNVKRKHRNVLGHPDPDAEVIALSPRSLLTTNRFVCEICNKGFPRDQNLQLHRRGHNLPWRLKQKESHENRKKVYVCPEVNCVHHDPARALGDLTGIKKHFFRKHGEKKWKCDKCSKKYAVHSDWKAHQKICGTKEYRCDCGTTFSRKDSFITHRTFCDVKESGEGQMCNKEETQKPKVDSGENAKDGSIEEISGPVHAIPSSVSQVTGEVIPSSNFTKPILSEPLSDQTISDNGSAPVPSIHMQSGINVGTTQGPGLSLCLEPAPGPGPSSAFPPIANPSTLRYSSLKDSAKLGHLGGSDSHKSSKCVPSKGAMGMLASLFSSPAHRQSGNDSGSKFSSMDDHDCCTQSVGLSTSVHDTQRSYLEKPSAATSATALLLKAAEIGAKASYPSTFQGHGTGVSASVRESPLTDGSSDVLVSSQASQGGNTPTTDFWASESVSRDGIGLASVATSISGVQLGAMNLSLVPSQVELTGNVSAFLKKSALTAQEKFSSAQ